MKLESISQESLIDTDRVLTRVVVTGVVSNCILARQMINVLGRPGVNSDMEMIGTNDTWTIVWTEPQLTLEEATHLMNQAIAPRLASTAIGTQS
ncbi:MAG: hypothetical protein AAF215_20640 [Cyanobacteria bacterium P01_A01_bin.123]